MSTLVAQCSLRVSLVGGGTDIPSVSAALPGSGGVVGFSINKKVTVMQHPFYTNGFRFKYSEVEDVPDARQLRHPIAAGVFRHYGYSGIGTEFASLADVKGGTGLGSSSAFCNCLVALCETISNNHCSSASIAYKSSQIEILECGRSIGMQDHFLCALAGVQVLKFHGHEFPSINGISYPDEWHSESSSPFSLVAFGGNHDSDDNLRNVGTKLDSLERLASLVEPAVRAIQARDLRGLGEVVLEGWRLKKQYAVASINNAVDEALGAAINRCGAYGGKLLGSGGAGFLLVIGGETTKLRAEFRDRFIPIALATRAISVAVISD